MRSSNPAFRGQPEYAQFGQPGQFQQQNQYGQAPYGQAPQGQQYGQQYGQPQQFGQPQQGQQPQWGGGYSPPPMTPTGTGGRMTIDDVLMRTGILFAILLATAAATWAFLGSSGLLMQAYLPIVIGVVVVTLIMGLIINRSRNVPVGLIIAYAAIEGVFVGAVSGAFNLWLPGIVLQAVVGTLGAFAAMLIAYKMRIIRASNKFIKWITILTIGYGIFALFGFVLAVTGIVNIWYANLGIGLVISLFAVGLASLNLIIDFDNVERMINAGAPEKEAWRAGFGLLVTLVWLYIEILRLISIIRSLADN